MSSQAEEVLPSGTEPNETSRTALSSEDFLKEFYKECGREVTLAYTTLNQMKNWAIVITAAILAAVVSVKRNNDDDAVTWQVIFLASSFALLFNLRFFVRAVICYVNLTRWNVLQTDIVELKLGRKKKKGPSQQETETKLVGDINKYYYEWLSPIGRWKQVSSNLKLGFGLLLALPFAGIILAFFHVAHNAIVMSVLVFTCSGAAIEGYEFFTTSFLDTPDRNAKRGDGDRKQRFPIPEGKGTTVALWLAAILLSALVYWMMTHCHAIPNVVG